MLTRRGHVGQTDVLKTGQAQKPATDQGGGGLRPLRPPARIGIAPKPLHDTLESDQAKTKPGYVKASTISPATRSAAAINSASRWWTYRPVTDPAACPSNAPIVASEYPKSPAVLANEWRSP